MFARALLTSLALAVLFLPAHAQQQQCAPRDSALAHLAEKYGETRIGRGLSSNGHLIELLTSESGDSWTLLVTLPDGTSCFITTGESWERLEREAPPEATRFLPIAGEIEPHPWIMNDDRYKDRNGFGCCKERHCQPVKPGEVIYRDGGWVHVPTGTRLEEDDPGVYFSRDPQGRAFRCIKGERIMCYFRGTGV